MDFYKEGKFLHYSEDPRYILAKHPCGGWGIYRNYGVRGKYDLLHSYDNLRQAKTAFIDLMKRKEI